MRDRLFAEGAESIENHHLLEMLLFHSIPRIDTRAQAVALLEGFGSLSGVFSADPERLMMVDGIGVQSAALIRIVAEISVRISDSPNSSARKYQTDTSIADFFSSLAVNATTEQIMIAGFSADARLIKHRVLDENNDLLSSMTLRSVVDFAVLCSAEQIAIAHVHPRGPAFPSRCDVELTRRMRRFLGELGIVFRGHYICSRDICIPIVADEI